MLTGKKQKIPGDQKCRGRGGPRGQGGGKSPWYGAEAEGMHFEDGDRGHESKNTRGL